MIKPRKISMMDLLITRRTIFFLGMEFLSWLCVEMARLTPMIQINQGNTRSATVNPFQGEWLKN